MPSSMCAVVAEALRPRDTLVGPSSLWPAALSALPDFAIARPARGGNSVCYTQVPNIPRVFLS